MNRVCITGRLTKDPTATPAGNTRVCKFTVAVRDSLRKDTTNFLDCEAWASKAEFMEKYFRKGQMIAVDGRLQENKWTDKDGNNRSKVVIRVDEVDFCSSKAEDDSRRPQFDQRADERRTEEEDFRPITEDDDLPF